MTRKQHGAAWSAVAAAYGEGRLTISEICQRYGIAKQTLYARARREGWPPRRTQAAKRTATAPTAAKAGSLALGKTELPKPKTIAKTAVKAAAKTKTAAKTKAAAGHPCTPPPQQPLQATRQTPVKMTPQARRARRRQFIRRLYDAMETKLSMIEERLEAARALPAAERGTAADNEREIRAFDAMARSFDRVATLDETLDADNDHAASGAIGEGRLAQQPECGGRAAASHIDAGADAELERWREELASRIRRLRDEWRSE